MTTSVEVPTQLFSEIQLRAARQGEPVQAVVEDLLRKGLAADAPPAATEVVASEEMLRRRREITDKFVSGEWGVELEGFEAGQEADRRSERELEERWRT